MTTGHVPDQDLLLLAHHALALWRSLRVRTHLRHCVQCQHRLTQLRQTSQLMASTIRDRSDMPWHPTSPPRGFLWQVATLVLLTLLIVSFAVWTIKHQNKPLPVSPIHGVPGGCRPDLPNDRCR